MEVADLHCDLLWYLANDPRRTPFDAESQASFPLLHEGDVTLQVFPIYSPTKSGSSKEGQAQWEIFGTLPGSLIARLSVENGSCFCAEEESLEEGLHRLEMWHKKHPLVYISLTWNEENRFGGGAATNVGLKEDGKKLLQWMSGKGIAVDLSHASDQLAEEILAASSDVTPIASHSNFRAIYPNCRNLPDHLAKEICARGGIIGLNLVRHFVGPSTIQDLALHIRHAHKLGIEDHLCLGADFFPEIDVEAAKAHMRPYFFEGFSTSACYPKLQEILVQEFPQEWVENLMHRCLKTFLGY